ncbi:MAG: Uma2 family endonuclease [Oscillospiraceae bacterium]|nr:Uma2 family endonuclease [Oscillospiraceae bacterium]
MDKNNHTNDTTVNEAQPAYNQIDVNQQYTYSDYMTWDDDNRWELIDGKAYMMSAPNFRHQDILGNVFNQLYNYLKDKACKVYIAALDVRLNADTLDNTVVQPDLIIVCDRSIIDVAGIKGVPEMVLEVLSPSTSRYDRTIKFNTYKNAGVKEYWVVDPVDETVAVHVLEHDKYITRAYSVEDEGAPVHVLGGFNVNLSEVFANA